jgi:hypothetical protein
MMEGVMDKEELKNRTKQFALRVIRLVEALPRRIGLLDGIAG